MNADERLADVLNALEAVGVRRLVMGGHAVRYYGLDRMTDDFDLHLAPDCWIDLADRLAQSDWLRARRWSRSKLFVTSSRLRRSFAGSPSFNFPSPALMAISQHVILPQSPSFGTIDPRILTSAHANCRSYARSGRARRDGRVCGPAAVRWRDRHRARALQARAQLRVPRYLACARSSKPRILVTSSPAR